MSNVIVNFPDDGWFKIGCNTKPIYKSLCIIIHLFGDRAPEIYQFRKADYLHSESDYFLDVSERWRLSSFGCEDEWEPGFATENIIDYWKPLGLPEKENERILKEIDGWFE